MKRKEIVEKAKKNVEEQELKKQIYKVERLIRNINSALEKLTEAEETLKDYLSGKLSFKIKEDNNGTISLGNAYTHNHDGISSSMTFST